MSNYYNEIAEGYNELHKAEQLQKLTAIWDVFQQLKITGKTLLDVGCGTGIASEFFANKGFSVMGVDPAEKLLEQNAYPHKIASAEKIPFKDASFDIVVSLTAIHNFNDIRKGLEEIRRVGKECFILTVLTKSKHAEEIDALIHQLFSVALVFHEAQDTIYFINT